MVTQVGADRDAARTALPVPPTPLLGREVELAVVQARLRDQDVRLLSLTGVGGVGKTRLALAAASGLARVFGDGVVFVDLAPLRRPELVTTAILTTAHTESGRHI